MNPSAGLPDVPRLLVVDDVEMNLRLAKSLLKRLGYAPETAHDGETALEKIAETPYDVVFMDIFMPGIDGTETTRRIRKLSAEKGRTGPWIVALTADVMEENRRRCLEAGMDDFLTKPIRLAEMESCFRRWRGGA